MIHRIGPAFALVASAVITMPCWAQENQPSSPNTNQEQETAPNTPAPQTNAQDQANPNQQRSQNANQAQMIYLSETVNQNLVNDNGETIASIDDIVVLPDGTISYFILGAGGVLGIGEDHLAIPTDKIRVTVEADGDDDRTVRFYASGLTENGLKNAPLLKEKGYAELYNDTWVTENTKFFGAQEPKMDKQRGFILGNEIVAANLMSAQNEKLAAIDYVVYDPSARKIKFIIVDNETTATDETLAAIPAHVVDWRRGEDRVLMPRVQMSQAELNAAPRVTLDDYNRFGQKDFQESVDRVFPKSDNSLRGN